MQANPPQLHSNLLYIRRYRHESRLASEAAYFYTNLCSAEAFIDTLAATSLSMDNSEFEKQMQSARALLDVNTAAHSSIAVEKHPPSVDASVIKSDMPPMSLATKQSISKVEPDSGLSVRREDQAESRVLPVESAALAASAGSTPVSPTEAKLEKESASVAKLEISGFPAVLEADQTGQLARDYPFLYASAGDLRVMDVEGLLADYKELVLKYVALCKAVEGTHITASSSRVFSPLLDLREPGSTPRRSGDLQRSILRTPASERMSLGDEQSIVKEEQAPEVKRTIETEGAQDLFEGMSLLQSTNENNLRSPSFRDMARQEHPSEFETPQVSGVEAEREGDETGAVDEHEVAEDTGHMVHVVFKSQDTPAEVGEFASGDHVED